ncbi:MAG: hypothetical protein QOF04_3448, partial [Solirubrobacteraceae bacterium]|nr:hypothetical protein [Solirubrobacteraceae bacterium]
RAGAHRRARARGGGAMKHDLATYLAAFATAKAAA